MFSLGGSGWTKDSGCHKLERRVELGAGKQRSLEHRKCLGEAQPQYHIFPCVSFSLLCRISQLVEGNFALFCTYTLGFRNEFQNLLLAIMVRVGTWGWVGSPGPKWQ